ncbi:hypothetical protein IMG5_100500 [Ichthyophthirius multifiliis]|uniref:HECT domain-containing protein n=1 Tax=Ichthyophthirius multifiliis TaxID=5932 RepID=G0QSA2_ICHMU|nr:hypothetical protein IMG5_100500 [Ichthyophthirius multifiliis]EGR31900.1 hypothetical protein IMG5_100500 [Ichthyophthirius multifiliis]|eukprot:XP_004035386.1 hypothetical protein IMG5_100500 [Ichthyophthirius multifiliis]
MIKYFNQILKFNFWKNKKNYKQLQEKIAILAFENPQNAWEIIFKLGFDLHLDLIGWIQGENPILLQQNLLNQLIKLIQIEICKETKQVLHYNPTNIRFIQSSNNIIPLHENILQPIGYLHESSTMQYNRLISVCSLRDIRYSWALIKLLNKLLQKSIFFINMDSKCEPLDYQIFNFQNQNNNAFITLSMSTQFSNYRVLCMNPIKNDLAQKVLNKTALRRDQVPKVQVERLKLQDQIDFQKNQGQNLNYNNTNNNQYQDQKAQTHKNIATQLQKEDFIFTKAYEQIKDIPITQLRPVKPTGTDPFIAFEIIFKGELVMGESGPYRQFFADISSELQPNVLSSHKRQLNLLCPSTNNLSKMGDSREKYVINPSAKSSYQLQLFEFLGILMGECIRTGTHLTLDLPRILWKQLVSQQVTLEDLEEIDKPVFDLIKFIENCEKEVFEQSFFETYTTTLSDMSTIELIRDGSKIQVGYEDRLDYIAKLVEAKIGESQLQIHAIKNGLNQIVPLPLLNLVDASDLEMWVCGKKNVDFDLLKRHTIYSGNLNENTPHVKMLWEVLHELNHTESLRFVKFCWGQERLPPNDEEFERNQTRFMIKPATYSSSNSDKLLPKADTCFFNLELPAYTNKASLKSQLLIAINTDCDSMNAEDPINLDPEAQYNRHSNGESSYEEE